MGIESRRKAFDEYIKVREDFRDAKFLDMAREKQDERKASLMHERKKFYRRRRELISIGITFEEIKVILLREYPKIVSEMLDVKIVLKDGTVSNSFDEQLKDQIARYGVSNDEER